jgi:hypothetical protein
LREKKCATTWRAEKDALIKENELLKSPQAVIPARELQKWPKLTFYETIKEN